VIESNVAPPATTPTDSARALTQTPSAAKSDTPDPAYESYREKAFAKYIKSAQGKTEHEKFIQRNRAQVTRAFPSFVPEFV
ncbi:hypothetical protein, partial [Enterococcus faecium]|uniref:hypothetical protein n=1 Tax=Enterococcus faecium TaxID=1352 RepID=UPI003DA1777D